MRERGRLGNDVSEGNVGGGREPGLKLCHSDRCRACSSASCYLFHQARFDVSIAGEGMLMVCRIIFAAALLAFSGHFTFTDAAMMDVPAGYYADQKVVYHNDGNAGDAAAYFKRMLNSINNHIEAVGQDHVEIRVVSHANGVELFQLAQTNKELAGFLDGLRAKNVRFLICGNTLRERKIDWKTLYGVKEDDIVPSGVAELARLQGMGFAYIHL